MKKQTKKVVEEKPLRLDLGCGPSCYVDEKGTKFTGIDKVKLEGVDIVHDLTKFPYPFADNSVDEIRSSHFLEHIDGPTRMKMMDELWRIMKGGAKAIHVFPYYKSQRYYQDPTHAWPPIVENSFLYFNKQWRETNKLDYYDIHCNFDFVLNYHFGPENWQVWSNKQEMVRNSAMRNYWEVIDDMSVTMICLK